MYIAKNKFDRYQISQKATDKDNKPIKDNAGNDVYVNMNVQFKKGCEPTEKELNKYGSYEGDLQFVDKLGHIRKAFLFPNVYTNAQGIMVKEFKLVLGDWQFAKPDGTQEKPSEPETNKDDNPTQVVIDPNELPFY